MIVGVAVFSFLFIDLVLLFLRGFGARVQCSCLSCICFAGTAFVLLLYLEYLTKLICRIHVEFIILMHVLCPDSQLL